MAAAEVGTRCIGLQAWRQGRGSPSARARGAAATPRSNKEASGHANTALPGLPSRCRRRPRAAGCAAAPPSTAPARLTRRPLSAGCSAMLGCQRKSPVCRMVCRQAEGAEKGCTHVSAVRQTAAAERARSAAGCWAGGLCQPRPAHSQHTWLPHLRGPVVAGGNLKQEHAGSGAVVCVNGRDLHSGRQHTCGTQARAPPICSHARVVAARSTVGPRARALARRGLTRTPQMVAGWSSGSGRSRPGRREGRSWRRMRAVMGVQ